MDKTPGQVIRVNVSGSGKQSMQPKSRSGKEVSTGVKEWRNWTLYLTRHRSSLQTLEYPTSHVWYTFLSLWSIYPFGSIQAGYSRIALSICKLELLNFFLNNW